MPDEVHEAWFDDNCLSFDGRVVELFGFSDSQRKHVREFGYEVKGPDRRGSYILRTGRLKKGKLKGGTLLSVGATEWPAVEAVLRRIDAVQADVGLADSATK